MKTRIIQPDYPEPQRLLQVREDHAMSWTTAESGSRLQCVIARREIQSYVRGGANVTEAVGRRDRRLLARNF